jgi:hypothetical protein
MIKAGCRSSGKNSQQSTGVPHFLGKSVIPERVLLEKQIPFDRAASKKILTPMRFYVNFFKKISYLGRPGRASGEDGENPSRPGRCEWGSSS